MNISQVFESVNKLLIVRVSFICTPLKLILRKLDLVDFLYEELKKILYHLAEVKLKKQKALSIKPIFKQFLLYVLLLIVIYLRIDKSYTIYLKLISRFPNSQITVT